MAVAVAQKRQFYKLWRLGRYSTTSVVATALDFLLFALLLHFTPISAIAATAIGRLAGALLTLLLHRFWVFHNLPHSSWRKLLVQYCLGNLLGILINMGGVWLFYQKMGIQPLFARAIAALLSWYFLYAFYKYLVYHKKTT